MTANSQAWLLVNASSFYSKLCKDTCTKDSDEQDGTCRTDMKPTQCAEMTFTGCNLRSTTSLACQTVVVDTNQLEIDSSSQLLLHS